MNLNVVILTIDKAGQILLERLAGALPENIKISLVVTRETRSYDFNGNPVVNACRKFQIRCIQPDFSTTGYLEEIKKTKPDLLIICNFHKIIKKELIEMPSIGAFNLHSSFLPELRGGTSIIWAIKQGYTKTGVTLHEVTEGVDDGDIVFQEIVPIDFWDTQGSLYEKITQKKVHLLIKFLKNIADGKQIIKKPQNHSKATYIHKRKDTDGLLVINQGLIKTYNHIRSFDPWTGAYFDLNGEKIRLRKAIPIKEYFASQITPDGLFISNNGSKKIKTLLIQSVSNIIEQPLLFDLKLAKKVLEFWRENAS